MLLWLLLSGLALTPRQGAPPMPGPERVTIQTSDGWRLVGEYQRPTNGSNGSAVLLLHGAVRDRRAYGPLAHELARRGVASLRLDLRGEGESINKGRFDPGVPDRIGGDTWIDVQAALEWMAQQSGISRSRIGMLGASYSAEAMAAAARAGAVASAYVALSPGNFSDASMAAIDASGRPWWFIASADERFAHQVVARVPTLSRSAEVTFVEGTSHASDVLSPHYFLNAEIADWFAARLGGRRPPEAWGSLRAGPFEVGFTRTRFSRTGETLLADIWYPAESAGTPMRFEDYLRLSTDLRGAVDGFPNEPQSIERTLATTMSGDTAIDPGVLQGVLRQSMAATRDIPPARARFPLVLWTPRYATTVAQSMLSEYLASRGFVIAFVRPERGGRLPFELASPADRRAELDARVADMRAALHYMGQRAYVDPARIGVLAWSYTGEMAVRLQREEPRTALVAGLSTNLLHDWVYDPEALRTLERSPPTAAYAVFAESRTPAPAPSASSGDAPAYTLEFPGLAHGSFNALEGYMPSRFAIPTELKWGHSGPAGVLGYEAMAVLLTRLLRHHLEGTPRAAVSRLALTTGISSRVVTVR